LGESAIIARRKGEYMGFFGDLLSLPIKIVNAPIRAVEDIFEVDEEDRVLSKPLDALADELEDVDE
jgi:hypothetical protein